MSINYQKLKSMVDHYQIFDLVAYITEEVQSLQPKSLTGIVKEWLANLQTEEELHELIRFCDEALLNRLSRMLTTYGYRRFGSIRMVTLYCDDLLREGKILDADDRLSLLISQLDTESVKEEQLEKIYFLKVRILLEMKQVDEASEWMKQVTSHNQKGMADRWGYFHLQLNDRMKAEACLKEGTTYKENGDFCYAMLADLYAYEGKHKQSLEKINEAIVRYPQLPSLYMDKVMRLKDLKEYSLLLETIEFIDSKLPYHDYQDFFTLLRADIYFEQKQQSQLTHLLSTKRCLKDSPYQKLIGKNTDDKCSTIKLPIVPIVQKDNYCVPASMSMMLRLLHTEKTQDEIGTRIYGRLGSKLSTAVSYFESLGFAAMFFTGTVEQFKELLDKGLPILVSLEFEQASHVQVVFGYDDELELFHVQDANFLSPTYVEYKNFDQHYANSGFLSIVASKAAADLASLSKEQDVFIRQLYDLIELVEANEEAHINDLVSLLKANEHVPFAAIYSMKHLYRKEHEAYIRTCINHVLEKYSNHDYLKLHAAYAFFKLDDSKGASSLLHHIDNKKHSSFYHYLKGRIALDEEKYDEAVEALRSSLQLDVEQHLNWSYLALAYMYKGNLEKAFECSTISLNMYGDESYTQINHGLILMEKERYAEARNLFDALLKENPKDAHSWFERARCDEHLKKFRKAYRGFQVAKQLLPTVPYPYLSIADLLQYQLEKTDEAESYLKEGMKHLPSDMTIRGRLGDLYVANQRYEEAIALYKEGLKIEEDALMYLGLSYAYLETGEHLTAVDTLTLIAQKFSSNSDVLLDAGSMLLDAAKEKNLDDQTIEFGFALYEEGIHFAQTALAEVLEAYTSYLEDTALLTRGIKFLTAEHQEHPNEILYMCYLGILYEQAKQLTKSEKLYQQALRIKQDALPYYRLGEIYQSMNRITEAKEAFQKCLTLDKTFEAACMKLAEMACEEQNRTAERNWLLQWIQLNPMEVNVEHAASLCETEKEYEELLEVLKSVKEIVLPQWLADSQAHVYRLKGDISQAETYLEKALELDPQNPAIRHHQAKWLIMEHRYEEARTILTELLSENPEDYALFQTFMSSFPNGKKLSGLTTDLKKIKMEKHSKSLLFKNAAEALNEYADSIVEEQQGSIFKRSLAKFKAKAKTVTLLGLTIELYELAIKTDPNNKEAVHAFAAFYEEKGLIEDSITVLKKSLHQSWDFDVAYHLANILVNIHENEQAAHEALNLVQKLLEQQPYHIDLQIYRAFILSSLEEVEKSETAFQELLQQEIYQPDIYAGLAKLYNKTERYHETVQLLQKAIEQRQEYEGMYTDLGIAYHLEGETEAAASLMITRVESGDEDLFIRYNLACYLAVLGKTASAQEELDYILAHDETGEFYELAMADDELKGLTVRR
ncbi:tetratricopeptide repeat protein [Priestia sp. YIM B13486]|uniref:tetratricopeptide repeat protein n=1 Tax=Priestia sp. YIM B13486 TaxID=3366304 RepID=UPI00366A9E34